MKVASRLFRNTDINTKLYGIIFQKNGIFPEIDDRFVSKKKLHLAYAILHAMQE
jgi:hypothetical protein